MRVRPLRQLLALQAALVAAVPFLLFLLFAATWLLPRLNAEAEARQQQLAAAIAAQVEGHFSEALIAVRGVAGAASLVEDIPPHELQHLLDTELVTNRLFKAIYVLDGDGRVLAVALSGQSAARRNDYLAFDLSRNSVFRDVRQQGQPVWSDTFLSVIGGDLSLAVAVPAGARVVMAEVELDTLSGYLAGIGPDRQLLTLVLDRRGQIVADQDGTYTAQQLNISNLPIVSRALREQAPTVGRFTFQQKEMYGSLVHTAALDWHVLVAEPVTQVYQSATAILLMFVGGFVVSVGIGVLLSLLLAYRLAGRFEQLADHARLVTTTPHVGSWPQANITEFQQLATGLQQMAWTLHERNQLLAALMGNIPGLVYRCAADSRRTLVFVSDACNELLGYSHDELLARPDNGLETLIHGEDRARVAAEIVAAVAADRPYRSVYRLRTRLGGDKWVSDQGRAVRNADNGVCLEGVLVDISDRILIEAELERARQAAEAASRAKSEFLANMSHELRTPLNGVLGMLQLLEEEETRPEQRGNIEIASSSGWALLQLLDDLLDLSRIEAGRLTIRSEPVQLAPLLQVVTHNFVLPLQQKGLTYRQHIDPRLPQRIMGDEVRLRQILLNLLGNAVKFTEQGTISVELTWCGEVATGGVLLGIAVSDTGIGIAPELREKIFEPFTQAEGSYQRRYQGAGLGLAIVRRLTELMHGEVSIASEPGIGTTVQVTVQVGQAVEALDPPPPEPTAPVPGGLRILLVEDNEVNRLALCRLLEHLGHHVTVAGNGAEGLECLAADPIDLVFMDIQMPVMDGVEALRRLRAGAAGARNTGVPVVALTAYAMDGDAERLLAAGMNAYLAKPVTLETLQTLLARYAAAP